MEKVALLKKLLNFSKHIIYSIQIFMGRAFDYCGISCCVALLCWSYFL